MFQLTLWQIALLLSPLLIVAWALWDLRSRTFENYNTRFLWIYIITFIPIIGAIAYFFIGRKKTKKES